MKIAPWLLHLLCWIIALTLATAAGLKMAGGNAGSVATDTMFGSLPAAARTTLVAAELALASWLVSNWRPRWAAFATILLLSAFLAAILIEMNQPAPKPCGCMGALLTADPAQVKTTLQASLALDSALLVGGLSAYFASARKS